MSTTYQKALEKRKAEQIKNLNVYFEKLKFC